MQKFKSYLIVVLICLICFSALSYKLSENPPGVYVDEATTSVNANSILKTGKDEYGKEFPIAFRFFGSYSPPLYTYLTVIPIYFSGLNEFSTRIISVISATLMIIVIFGFLKSSKFFDGKIIPWILILFIFTPWNFFYGRIGYEIYLGFFLFSLGTLLLWLGLKTKILLPFGIMILSLCTYAAHSQIYSVPIFLLIFIIIFFKQIKHKYLFWGLISAALLQIPHLLLLNTKAFLNKSDLFYANEILTNADKIILPQILSIPLSFLFSFLARITSYFSPKNLFFFPDPDPQRSMPDLSVFYNWMIIPFFIGIFILISKISNPFTKFIIILTLAVVLPASLTSDSFSTQRALGLLLPLFLIIALGIQKIAKKIGFGKFTILFLGILVFSLIILWRSYFVLMPLERAEAWNTGFKDLAKIIKENPDKTFIIDRGQEKPAYIELAFFLKTDPQILQNAADPKIRQDYYNLNEFKPEYKFNNIDIRKVVWENDIYKVQILVGSELLISQSQAKEHFLTEMFVIKNSRGHPIFKSYITDPKKKCQATNNNSPFCKTPNF